MSCGCQRDCNKDGTCQPKWPTCVYGVPGKHGFMQCCGKPAYVFYDIRCIEHRNIKEKQK